MRLYVDVNMRGNFFLNILLSARDLGFGESGEMEAY